MAQNDYVVRFTGRDDLTKVINLVKRELESLGGDKFGVKFERIVSSSANLNNKIKQLKNLLNELSWNKMTDTNAFKVATQYLKSLEAAINNAKTASNNFRIDIDTRGILTAQQRLILLKQQIKDGGTGQLVQLARQLLNALNNIQLPKTDLLLALEQYLSLILQIRTLRSTGTDGDTLTPLVSQARALRDLIVLAEAAQNQLTSNTGALATYLDLLLNKYDTIIAKIQQAKIDGGSTVNLVGDATKLQQQLQPLDLQFEKIQNITGALEKELDANINIYFILQKMKTARDEELALLERELEMWLQIKDNANSITDSPATSFSELSKLVNAGGSSLKESIFLNINGTGSPALINLQSKALLQLKLQLKQVNDSYDVLSTDGLELALIKLQKLGLAIKDTQFKLRQLEEQTKANIERSKMTGRGNIDEILTNAEKRRGEIIAESVNPKAGIGTEFSFNAVEEMRLEYNTLKQQIDAANASLDGTSLKTVALRTLIKQLKNSIAEGFIQSGGTLTPELQKQFTELSKLLKAWKKMNVWAEAYSNMRPKLAAFNATITITTSALQTVQGAMSYFGVESEEAMKTLNKLYGLNTAIMGLSLLIPTIAKLPRILTVAASALLKCTVALTALNWAARQNPYLLVAGVALTAVAAVWKFREITRDSSKVSVEDAQAKKQQAEWLKILAETTKTYNSNISKSYAELLAGYERLKKLWNSTDNKAQFLKTYGDELSKLTTKIHNAADAEKFFNGNSDLVKRAFMERAKAAASAAASVEILQKAMETITNNPASNTVKYKKLPYGAVKRIGNQFVRRSDEEVDAINEKRRNNAIAREMAKRKANQKTWNDALAKSNKLINDLIKYQNSSDSLLGKTGNTPKKDNTPKNTPKTDNEPKYLPNAHTLDTMRENVDYLQKKLGKTPIDTKLFKEVSDLIDEWNKKIDTVTNKEKELSLIDNAKTQQDINNNIEYYNKQLEKTIVGSKEWFDLQNKIQKEQSKFNPVEKGSIADLENQLRDLEDRYRNTADSGLRVKLKLLADNIQSQLDLLTEVNKYTIKAEIEPISINSGDIWDLRGSRRNAENLANLVSTDYSNGIIDYNTARRQIIAINKQLTDLGLRPIDIEIKPKFQMDFERNIQQLVEGINGISSSIDGVISSFERLEDANTVWEKISAGILLVTNVMSTFSTVMQLINTLTAINTSANIANAAATTQATAADTIKSATSGEIVASAVANTVALTAEKHAFLEAAAAAIFAAHAYIPFAGVGIATGFVTQMLASMAAFKVAIQAFSNGGIIQGNSTHGDLILARVNAGEMILNPRQQSNLFNMLNSGDSIGSSSVEFKIKGDVLYGVLHNYNKIHNKIR